MESDLSRRLGDEVDVVEDVVEVLLLLDEDTTPSPPTLLLLLAVVLQLDLDFVATEDEEGFTSLSSRLLLC